MSGLVGGALDSAHDRLVLGRRVRVLAERMAELMPPDARVLDVGSGDGEIAAEVMRLRPDVRMEGIDVLVRADTRILVRVFDGAHIPGGDASVDVTMLVDVLHHADDPAALLAEAGRVCGRAVIVKDHLTDPPLAVPTLRFMDRVGNARHGVRLPYRYLSRAEWLAAIDGAGLRVDRWVPHLGLYPAPASWLFERGLHFAARLVPK